jgi:photosynthetic reaction center H subunit
MIESEWSADDHDRSPSEREPEHGSEPRLVHLADGHDLRVAEGDPDIRGWAVRTAHGEKIGTVKDLIVDTALMKVRYIEARIDRETLNSSGDRYVLIPVGSARLDDAKDDVYLDAAVVDPRSLPPYDRSPLSREYEQYLQERFPVATAGDAPATRGPDAPRSAPAEAATARDDLYADVRYDDARFLGGRRQGRDGRRNRSPQDASSRDSAPGDVRSGRSGDPA